MIAWQEKFNVNFLALVIYHIKEKENQEFRRFLCITSAFLLTGFTSIYSVILFPLFSQYMGLLYSLRTIKQKKQFLKQYLEDYIYWNLKYQY